MESGEFAARARRAYELGRLQWALRGASGTLLLVTASVLFGGNMLLRLVVGAALLLTVTFCLWRGQMLATAVRPGLLAGLFPFGLLLTMRCAAGHFCEIADCGHWMAFCGAGGLVAGVLLAAHAWHLRDGALTFLIAGSTIAALTGLLGCFAGGIMGAVWMAFGEMAATLPAFAHKLHRR